MTPLGSSCSVQFGVGLTDASPGSARTSNVVVPDIEAARDELVARGVRVTGVQHKSTIDGWTGDWQPGAQHRDHASVAEFADPDGNTWVIQEIGYGESR